MNNRAQDELDENSLPGWTHVYSGKVRDLYVPNRADSDDDSWTGDPLATSNLVLMVASDRVSAFDRVLRPDIPGKGVVLTRLTRWWFAKLDSVPNHLASPNMNAPKIPESLADRALLCRTLDMFPIECVVREYIAGSGWQEYSDTGAIGGTRLPSGLTEGDQLPQPVYTPAWKAPLGKHDQNISFDQTVALVGATTAERLRELSLQIFKSGAVQAGRAELVLADTKFEFGANRVTGEITLGDEVLTPDSSRYWEKSSFQNSQTAAERMTSFDKQIVRDWLTDNWDRHGTPPTLPGEIVTRIQGRYQELLQKLTGI